MKVKTLSLLAGAALAGSAQAGYLGISYEFQCVNIGGIDYCATDETVSDDVLGEIQRYFKKETVIEVAKNKDQ